MDWNEIGFQALSPVLLAALTWLAAKVAQLIHAKVRGEYLRGVLLRLDDAVLAAVREVHQVAVSAEAAASYARQAVRAFNDPPYTIVRTQVPESVLARPGISATVDRGIPAYVLPEEALPGLPYEILNYSPVPR